MDMLYKIKWAYQRAVRGYDDTAFWSLNSYLTDIALPVLKRYRKEKSGYPSTLESKEEWDKILDKMIRAFQLMHDDDYTGIPVSSWGERQKEIDEGLALFAKHYQSLWD